MLLSYLLTFCRITIGTIFAYAFLTKTWDERPFDLEQFSRSITNYKLLSSYWSRPLALILLICELIILVCILIGGQWLPIAFGLAIFLLLAFTAALVSVRVRNIKTSCNCFGRNKKPITYIDIGRNIGLLLVAIAGLWATGEASLNLGFFELVLMFIIAITFVLIWTNLNEIITLLRIT